MESRAMEGTAAAAGTVTFGDITVSRMGYGAMRLTGDGVWGPPEDREEAKRILRAAVDELGVELIDTADSYGPDVNEEIIAEALHPYPDHVLIATKGGLYRPGRGEWPRDARPEKLREALEGSLERLRVERIDVYQLHAPDPEVPIEDSLGELVRLREEGKIRHVAVSNFQVPELERALEVTDFVSVQNRYNVLDRGSEAVVDWCEANDKVFLPWGPLARGDTDDDALEAVARRHDASTQQIALAWLLHRSAVIAPIPGTSSMEHLRDNVAAAGIELGEADLERLG